MKGDKLDVLHRGEYLWQKLRTDFVARLVFQKQDLSLDQDRWYKMRSGREIDTRTENTQGRK